MSHKMKELKSNLGEKCHMSEFLIYSLMIFIREMLMEGLDYKKLLAVQAWSVKVAYYK